MEKTYQDHPIATAYNQDEVVEELRKDIKRARRDIAMLATLFNFESKQVSISVLVELLEKNYWRPDALADFIESNYKL